MKAVLSLVLALAFCAGLGLYFWIITPPHVEALWYQPARQLSPFELSDQRGQPFTQENLKGHWSLLFLGYTSCPDVCPATLSRLSASYPQLEEAAGAPVQVLFLSADPGRDSTEKLAAYIHFFRPEFIALRAESAVLEPFTRQLGLMYRQSANGDISHSAGMVLINPQGQLEAMFRPAEGNLPLVDTRQLVADLAVISHH
ncbi:SCO family protein [Gallaecimonas pentaromativorans]|uniref:Protein SCO1/2 n=1 Tax=Gallaecimonas pentaromativorans TaxID=584787 RepID=A0A3N1P0Q0_9GAMM|nr:SCO family protein [Gallaecimonas pentaromativorans]ROQ22025.1 protein SCO1/2 [Gallaecimonas pentaromativorans]